MSREQSLQHLTLFCLLIGLAVPGFSQQGQKGIEAGDIDRNADPCEDFFEFSNGTWRAQHPIPASMDRWSRRWEAGETNKDQLRVILDDVSSRTGQAKGSPGQLTGDFYAACTDQKAIDEAGITPLQPLLHRVDSIRDIAGIESVIIELQVDGLAVPFTFSGTSDLHNPQEVVADIGASGLGLPDRDYYVKPDKRFADARAGYVEHVTKIFRLAGSLEPEAKAAAQTVMTIETAFAKASLDNVALRDPAATDHTMSFAELQKLTPHFDWTALYRSASVTPASLNVEQPEFFKEIERQLVNTSVADWKVYLRWQLLNNFADNLSTPFVDEHFAFFQRQLAGIGELKPRPIRCAEQTDSLLGEALGQEYVKRYFPPAAKARANAMVQNIIAAMHDTIDGLDWMTPPTKQKALQKLTTLNVKVGYPDKWKDYSSVTISRDAYFEDIVSASRFSVADNRSTIGKPVDRSRWGMTPPTSDAYYNPLLNEIVFPAGILQPPAFSMEYTDAVNYGAIGVVIGHEISHGFDDQGSRFDAQGRLSNWWGSEDNKKFEAKTGCVVKQFDSYTVLDSHTADGGIHINGKLVLGESIGDLAGLKIAYLAFKKSQTGKPAAATIDGFTPDQQFFVSWGQFRGDETRPEKQKLMVQSDPHPVAKYRVLGPLSNFEPFAKAFQCKPGSAMVRPPDVRCTVW
jgi:endothelin-converting enzyme/putative endopeptidase